MDRSILQLWLLVSLSTLSSYTLAQENDPRSYVGKDSQIAIKDLVIEDDNDAQHWKRLHTCLSSRSDQSWEAFPLRMIGNFAQTDACKGKGAQLGCSGGRFRTKPGSQWWEVSTLRYTRSPFFGYMVNVGANPLNAGVGVSMWWSEKGRTITGERLVIDFSLWQKNLPVTRFSISDELSYTIKQTTIKIPVKESRENLIRQAMGSSEGLKTLSLTQLEMLKAKVTTTLKNNQVTKCIYGPYEGRGVPPECEKIVPLSMEERDHKLKKIQMMFNAQREFITQHADAIHAQLLKDFPQSCITK